MSPDRLRRWTIPFIFRVVVLRFLLTATAAITFFSIFNLILYGYDWVLALFVIISLLMVTHHVLRLWPRRYWLVIFELIVSLVEVLAAGFVFGIFALAEIDVSKDDRDLEDLPVAILLIGIASTIPISSIFAFFFLLWDTVSNRKKGIMRSYDFSVGLYPPGHQWSMIFGRHNTRKQFSTDNLFIRCIRGGVAVICLLAMSFLVYYDAFWNPISSAGRITTTTLKVNVPDTEFPPTLNKLAYSLEGWMINAVLMVPNISAPHQYPTMDLSLTYSFAQTGAPTNCTSGHNLTAVFAYCPLTDLPQVEGDIVDILVTIHFSEVPSDSEVYLGMTNSTADTLANAEPTSLGPGSNIHGTSSIVIKNRLANIKSAILGLNPQHRQFVAVNVRGQTTDWLPSLPRGNNIATLRVTMKAPKEIEIEEERTEVSVLDGFAKIGGIWSFTKGVFAAIFGSTLLFELFGIKPLSVYGLIHLFRPGRPSLAEGNDTLSPERRDRIVRILKDHLLDIDEEEEDAKLPSHDIPLDIVPHATHSTHDVCSQV